MIRFARAALTLLIACNIGDTFAGNAAPERLPNPR